MRFSPHGDHLLGGVGSSGAYVDGALVFPSAGGWDWIDAAVVMGPGGYDAGRPGFYRYPLPSGPAQFENALAATDFYANGYGSWVRYLADGRTGSTDSNGNAWPDRVAVGFAGLYQVFTEQSRIPLIFRDITTGLETREAAPGEWTPFPDGSGYFSIHSRGVFAGGRFYACGYLEAFGGLCVWQPFDGTAPVWKLSGTPDDFNPDIAVRQVDGMLVVGSGINQGETGQHLYELDPLARVWRKDGAAWQPLLQATPPGPEPVAPVVVAPFTHYAYEGPFFATGQYGNVDHPGNSEVLIRTTFDQMVRARYVFADAPSASSVPAPWLRGIYFGFEAGQIDEAGYERHLGIARARGVPLLVYYDAPEYPDWVCRQFANQPNIVPCVQAYPAPKNPGEPVRATPAQDVARIRGTVEHLRNFYDRVAIARTMYTQSGNYPLQHILDMQPGLTDLVRELRVFADLWFAWLRDPANAIAGNPELQAWATALPGACVGAAPPVLEDDTPPNPDPPRPPAAAHPLVLAYFLKEFNL